MDWSLEPPEPLYRIKTKLEYLIAITVDFNLLQISPNQNEFKWIKRNESVFNDFCLVYPTGEYLLALSHSHRINCYKVSTGEIVSVRKSTVCDTSIVCFRWIP